VEEEIHVGGLDYRHLRCETKGRWKMIACGVKSSKGALMAPLRRDQMTFKDGWRRILGIVIVVIILCRAWELYREEDRALVMVERILPAMEGSRDGHNHGQNLGGRGVGGPIFDSVIVHLNGFEGEDLGEKWFFLENSPAEVRALTRLKGELGSTLLFEHGEGQSANPLWVACILLRRLFHEWFSLD